MISITVFSLSSAKLFTGSKDENDPFNIHQSFLWLLDQVKASTVAIWMMLTSRYQDENIQRHSEMPSF
jgi:hypothetical protein